MERMERAYLVYVRVTRPGEEPFYTTMLVREPDEGLALDAAKRKYPDAQVDGIRAWPTYV